MSHQLLADLAESRYDESRLDRLRLLTRLAAGETGPQVVETHPADPSTVRRGLTWARANQLVTDTPAATVLWPGRRLATQYRSASHTLDDAGLRCLATASARRQILHQLTDEPARKAALATDDGPTRSTVHRAIARLIDYGWVTRTQTGRYTATDTGQAASDVYATLATRVDRLCQYGPTLAVLPDWAVPPLDVLPATPTLLTTADSRLAMGDAFVRLLHAHQPCEQVRFLVSVFSPAICTAIRPLLQSDCRVRLLLGRRAARQLTRPANHQYLRVLVTAPATTIRVSPLKFATNLSWYDGDIALVGGCLDTPQAPLFAARSDALTGWARTLFETFWTDAAPPSPRLQRWLTVPAQTAPVPS